MKTHKKRLGTYFKLYLKLKHELYKNSKEMHKKFLGTCEFYNSLYAMNYYPTYAIKVNIEFFTVVKYNMHVFTTNNSNYTTINMN